MSNIYCIFAVYIHFKMKDKIIRMKELFAEGLTPTMVANKLEINQKGIHYYINKYNIEVLNKGRLYNHNDKYFDNIDCENKAYLLGFFIADGYITSNNRICIQNSIDDLEIMEFFKNEISPESKFNVRDSNRGCVKRKTQFHFRITSEHMYNILNTKYKIKERKTLNASFIFDFDNIPKEYLNHFVRGFFDGDGSVSFIEKETTPFFNFSFVFTSLNFTKQISEIFESLFNIKSVIYTHQGKTCMYYTLRFDYSRNRKLKIKEIYNWLYSNSNICLNRKKTKFQNYLEYRAKHKI